MRSFTTGNLPRYRSPHTHKPFSRFSRTTNTCRQNDFFLSIPSSELLSPLFLAFRISGGRETWASNYLHSRGDALDHGFEFVYPFPLRLTLFTWNCLAFRVNSYEKISIFVYADKLLQISRRS